MREETRSMLPWLTRRRAGLDVKPRILPLLATNLLLAAVYYAAAKFGLTLAFEAEQVTLVWPPTGIALAAVILFGYRVWPGVMAGAFLANFTTPNETLPIACGIAVGNTLEAIAGAWLLLRLTEFDVSIQRLTDVLALVAVAAISPIISATIGVTSLCTGGTHPWDALTSLWFVWWLGDTMGAILVTPLILTWSLPPRIPRPMSQLAESVVLLALVSATSLVVFAGVLPQLTTDRPLPYAIFPFIIWAALRLGQAASATVTALVAAIAIYGAVHGFGPFYRGSPHESLILLHAFLGALAITALLLGAATAERNIAERRRAIDYAISHVLNEAADLSAATPAVLRTICESLEWDFSALWRVDEAAQKIVFVQHWHRSGFPASEFEDASREHSFAPGAGLPGRVWASRAPAWIPDVTRDTNFPRAPVAVRAGLHGAFAFPICLRAEVFGVMEFFSREIRQPDAGLLRLFANVGVQIGAFIDRKRSEQKLRETEKRFRFLAETIPSFVWIAAPDGTITYANQRWFDYSGLTLEQTARNWPELALHPDDRERCIKKWTGALREGKEYEIEVRNRRHDGAYRWFITRAVPRRDAAGQILSWFGITTDIHNQKELQEQLRQADRNKDEFLAVLAHELRNPLAPLRNALEIMRISGQDGEIQEMMERQVNALVRLVDDLLEVSRFTRGKIELRRARIALTPIVQSAIETSRPLIEAGGHRLKVNLPSEPLIVDGDSVRLSQVVANLLNNAAKYTEAGGEISLGVERVGDQAVLRVRDTGVGIPAEMLPRVFDMFTQLDRSENRAQGGLGIGLSLVRSLVTMHGGTVQASSDGPGKGSEFLVRLPLAMGGFEPEAAPSCSERSAARKCTSRILVVDDNRDAARSVAILLRMLGNEIEVAHDGPTSLEVAAAYRPDVVLLDIGLPGMDGYEVARRMRALPALENVSLIAVTGWGQEEDRRRSQSAGFNYHLIKPLNLNSLETLLASLADGR
jgi:PAS domain S-box-containing protein